MYLSEEADQKYLRNFACRIAGWNIGDGVEQEEKLCVDVWSLHICLIW